jgi:hypothetical protein
VSQSAEERRQFPRVRAEVPVHLKQLVPGDLEGPAKTFQVGLGGCSVIVGEPVGEGSAVELMLDLMGQYITVVGEVVYERTRPDETFETGIRFLSVAPEHEALLKGVVEGEECEE